MRIPRIFFDHTLNVGQDYSLLSDRAHYVSNVLRLSAGRPLIVFNGRGGEYEATLLAAGKKEAALRIDRFVDVDRESPLRSRLAIGLARGDRMDWIVQKATELGVTAISPLYTERTEVKLSGERLAKKLGHWRQIIIGACEQSQRNRLPTLHEPIEFSDFVSQCQASRKLILHPGTEGFSLDTAGQDGANSAAVLVGPEGGFSDDEVERAKVHEFLPWPLGPRILRAETAPIAALALLQHSWGDW
ncbi:MAG: 16S rRNA (uracil(1498)-N(3))-methyltransferase [Cellvibrionaceae bacterium]